MTEQQGMWVAREERPLSPSPTTIEPHPDDGALPPCEYGRGSEHPCTRLATTRYGYGYYCAEHVEVIEWGKSTDEAALALYHARRMLGQARVQSIDRLVEHLGKALEECEEDLKRAEQGLEEADRVAGGAPDLQL